MQKIYVLLRNDQQTGPYSLDEIAQFDLKPYDLIWIEGKSAGWYYPQEIGALHPYLKFLPQKPKPASKETAAEKKAFDTIPVATKKEAPQAAPLFDTPGYTPQTLYTPAESPSKDLEEKVFAQFSKPSGQKEAAYIHTTPATNQKKKTPNPVAVGIVTVLIVGGVFAASWVMNRHSGEEQTATAMPADVPVQNEVATTDITKEKESNTKNTEAGSASAKKRQKNNLPSKQRATGTTFPVPQGPKEKIANNPVSETNDYSITPPEKSHEPATRKETTNAPVETTAPQEKKKLRDKIFDIFRKKPDESNSGEATPSENSERRATHREGSASLAQMVHVRFDVPNDWMMGIKGAKATLVNRSSEKISKATVEVSYYDDDNQLLQKKIITFGKVDGKGKQTLSIPDHSTATKVDYSIVSVTGQPSA